MSVFVLYLGISMVMICIMISELRNRIAELRGRINALKDAIVMLGQRMDRMYDRMNALEQQGVSEE